jgi:hypothetical protein
LSGDFEWIISRFWKGFIAKKTNVFLLSLLTPFLIVRFSLRSPDAKKVHKALQRIKGNKKAKQERCPVIASSSIH